MTLDPGLPPPFTRRADCRERDDAFSAAIAAVEPYRDLDGSIGACELPLAIRAALTSALHRPNERKQQ